MGPKTDEAISGIMKESITDAEDSTAHKDEPSIESKEKGRMLVAHGKSESHTPDISNGATPTLRMAAKEGNLETVKMLLGNGAEINATNSKGRTALHNASMKGHKALVAYLLDHGADVNHADRYGMTSILLAVHFGFTEIAQLLIDRGADLQCRRRGWAPIHLSHDQPEMTRCLLRNGADVNGIGKQDYTPLYIAAFNDCPEVVKVLLLYKPNLEITHIDENDRTALTVATERGKTEVVRLLLEAGADINHRSGQNKFPLQFAVAENREDTLRILMKYDPKVDLVDNDGNTALHCINSRTSVSIAKILDVGGADLNILNKEQDTPLCKAVWFNNLRIVKYLANEAKLDTGGWKNGGPLHIACYKSNTLLVKILVNAGANVNNRYAVVGTPLKAACLCEGSSKEEQESTILYLINEAKVDIDIIGGLYGCAFNAACGRSSEKVVKLMLERGANSEVADVMGRTAIHFAAARSIENFYAIQESWANVDWADKMGRTALHWAAIGGMPLVVYKVMQLSRGSVDQGDRDGWTPLLWAARGSDTEQRTILPNEQEAVIEFLLYRGADPCVRAKGLDQEWSPVKVAKYHGANGKVIRLLERKAKEKLEATGGENAWDEEFHASRKAAQKSSWCDCCLSVSIMLTVLPRSLASAQSLFFIY